MGVPVRGITTDAEKGLVPAVKQVFPEVPYQLCRTHFLKNCARPMEPDLQALGASVALRAERVRKRQGRRDPSEAEGARSPAPHRVETASPQEKRGTVRPGAAKCAGQRQGAAEPARPGAPPAPRADPQDRREGR